MLKQFAVFLTFFCFLGISSHAAGVVASPSVRCLAVQANGNVMVTWVLPDTVGTHGAFNSYHIYSSSNAAGPFTDVDSVFAYSTNSMLVTTVNANAATQYFYVLSRSGTASSGFAPITNTLHTIFLNVTNPGTGTADLNWNPLSIPLPPTSTGWYKIYREHPANTWSLLDSTRGNSWVDTINICNAVVNYRIEIADSSGCSSVSNVAGGVFHDIIGPPIVIMDSVSVDANGHAQIGWRSSPAKDTKGYVIYKYTGGIWTAIDTVFGKNNTYLNYLLSLAGNGSETYGVSAFDSCGNISALSQIQKSMFLKYKRDICAMSITLTWNNFIHFPAGSGGYDILVSVNSGAWNLAGTSPPNDSTFTMSNLTALSTYCFMVVAKDAPDVMHARSNEVCYLATIPKQPNFNYLRVATVQGSNSVMLMAYVDVTANVHKYDFYRGTSPTGNFTFIGTVPAPSPSTISITDNGVNPSQMSYYYRMYVVDSCGTERSVTNTDKTILLGVSSNDETTTNTLTWSDYEFWLGNVSSYNVYRAVDGVWQTTPIGNVPYSGGLNTYNDNVSAFYSSNGKFEYYVEALEGGGNPYGFADSSRSNVAEALQNAELYIPNAFVPRGVNSIFKPVGSFVEVDEYHFMVFDRWGEKVFETSDKNGGWDGTVNGKKGEEGTYAYLISYKTSHGEYVDRKGGVTLIR
jgi:gliding motility-associated-like protein